LTEVFAIGEGELGVTKALAPATAVFVVVFNCSPVIDASTLTVKSALPRSVSIPVI
jgi:hypothetical protein